MRYVLLSLLVWVVGCGQAFEAELFPGGAGGELGFVAGSGGTHTGGHATGGVAGLVSTGGASAAGSNGEAGAASGGGGVVEGTGGSTGGSDATGGASTGGTPSNGGAATGGSSTGGATVCSMTESIAAALPETFVWQSYSSTYFTGSYNACEKCRYSPCGTCPIMWGTVVQSNATTFLVPIASSVCSVPALYGECPAANADTIKATVQSAVVTLTVSVQGSGSVIADAVVSGTWTLTGNYSVDEVGTTALNNSVSQALRGLPVACQ